LGWTFIAMLAIIVMHFEFQLFELLDFIL